MPDNQPPPLSNSQDAVTHEQAVTIAKASGGGCNCSACASPVTRSAEQLVDDIANELCLLFKNPDVSGRILKQITPRVLPVIEKWCAQIEAIQSKQCITCEGRGEIGGFVNAESGYQNDPCPDCQPKPQNSSSTVLSDEGLRPLIKELRESCVDLLGFAEKYTPEYMMPEAFPRWARENIAKADAWLKANSALSRQAPVPTTNGGKTHE